MLLCSVYSRHLARGKFPRKCKMPWAKKEKELGGREKKGKDPRELFIPPGARSLEYRLFLCVFFTFCALTQMFTALVILH